MKQRTPMPAVWLDAASLSIKRCCTACQSSCSSSKLHGALEPATTRRQGRALLARFALLQRTPDFRLSVAPVPLIGEQRELPAGLSPWQIRRVVAHVEANLSTRIRVPELAKLLDLSTSHFSRAFKRALGESPHAYVLRRRIAVAQGLMLMSSEPLSSIALRCGMYDQANMTHHFRRIVGDTPHSWRRRWLGALNVDLLARELTAEASRCPP